MIELNDFVEFIDSNVVFVGGEEVIEVEDGRTPKRELVVDLKV
jgi:hypothetical protein